MNMNYSEGGVERVILSGSYQQVHQHPNVKSTGEDTAFIKVWGAFGGRWGRIFMRNEGGGKHSHPNHSFTYLIQTESDRALMTPGSRLECIRHSFREIGDKNEHEPHS